MKNNLVMLVEDDDSIRFTARMIIESQGYKVEDFAHGLSAFERLVELNAKNSQSHYGLIWSDIDMPEMNGLIFAQKCTHLAPSTPLVLMTGVSRDSYPQNVREVLLKPFAMPEYKRVLNLYLPLD